MDDNQLPLDENTVILNVPGQTGQVFKPGDIVGDNYRLIELIGRGGMGVVYRCQHQIMGNQCALKVLSPEQVNAQSWQRFEVEGKAIARLDHPNIVKIFNMGVDRQQYPYYVMELLQGHSLATYSQGNQSLSLKDTLEIFGQLAAGLGYAHKKGIVHRDIKPSNIILEKGASGQYIAKIVDFGLAKLVDRQSATAQSLTNAGDVFGSPPYMSPEQSLGQAVDARSDIYSLGCTLYQTLTGRPPFYAENALKTIMLHQSQAVPSLDSAVKDKSFPQALEDLVQTMLAKRPEDRYQSMEQIGHDLSRLQEGKTLTKGGLKQEATRVPPEPKEETQPVPDNQPSSRANWLWITALCALVPTALVTCWLIVHHGTATSGSALVKPVGTGREDIAATGKPPDEVEKPDSRAAKVKASFASFTRQDTESFQRDGRRWLRFYFPTYEIGKLSYVDSDREPRTVPAAGVREVPSNHSVRLTVQSGNSYTWDNPWIMDRIDLSPVNSLEIEGRVESEQEDEVPLLRMLNTAGHWQNLESLSLKNTAATPRILNTLEKIPHLHHFSNTGTEVKARDLVATRFLYKLDQLTVGQVGDVEGLVVALNRTKKLNLLGLECDNLSTRAIDLLKGFPRLEDLWLTLTNRPTMEELEALSQLTNVKRLQFYQIPMKDPLDLTQLKGLNHFDKLVIVEKRWQKWQVDKIKQAFPRVEIIDKNLLGND